MSQLDASPLISIITPVYNGAQYLEELILSVDSQNYSRVEHIVIDDGSTDEGATVAIIKRFPHLRWWSRENQGQYASMNEGLLAARGDFVCFVSADDIVSQGAITVVADFFWKNPQFDGLFGKTLFIDEKGEDYPYPVPFRMAPLRLFPYFAHISHCSFYIRREACRNQDLLFDPSLRYVGDYDWLIRISRSRLRVGSVKRELAKVRLHPNQTSQFNLEACLAEKNMIVKRHTLNRILYPILSGVYILAMRLIKIGIIYKDAGMVGVFMRLYNWLWRPSSRTISSRR